jgi:hypothetical protein
MAGYVPWYGKKRAALAYREDKLLRVLRRGGPSEEAARAAEEVRASRIRWLRSERSRLPCNGLHSERIRKYDEQIQACESEPAEVIVDEFRRKLHSSGNLPGGTDEPANRD